MGAGAGLLATTGTDSGVIDAGIVVDKVDGLRTDFINGVDVSSVLALEASGVIFRDDAGTPADLFAVLAEHGVTDVRVRVWNDPHDSDGRSYGGGTTDAAHATEIGKRATDAGLRVLVDFHYSDFWADPAKQRAPKAWEDMSNDERASAAGEYTRQTLTIMRDAGVDVRMVQVGNETNNGVAGVTAWDGMAAIFSAGSAAVRDVYPDALVAVHFANPEQEGTYARYASILDNFDVDYDVFASSYYPFWHGTTENLTAVLSDIARSYDKQVIVAETSWVRTLNDGDGSPNVVGTADLATAYPVSVQGQATAVRDVIQAVVDVGDAGIGVYYWEPAWLPVGTADDLAANTVLWERDGSGWATSFAGEYDPDAANEWGGSGWDNQSLFAADGTPLESLNIFEYARRGATAPLAVTTIDAPVLDIQQGESIELPATVTVHYNDGTTADAAVTWEGGAPTSDALGEYTVAGTVGDGAGVNATITVRAPNDLLNAGFEEDDLSMWSFESDAATFSVVDDNVPAAIGERVFNFWDSADYSISVAQTVEGLAPGTYVASVSVHGGPADTPTAKIQLVATTAAGEWSAPLALNGWQEWDKVSVPGILVGEDGVATIAVTGTFGGEDWGFIDGFELHPEDG